MIGAIVGDIVGSVYEWNNIKTKDFPLFSPECFFTDDTVMTLATAEGLMNGASKEAFIKAMKRYGRLYPYAGYGGRFGNWLFSDDTSPYNSWKRLSHEGITGGLGLQHAFRGGKICRDQCRRNP